MNGDSIIEGERLFLRLLHEDDVNEQYLGWMNDQEVTRYTESSGTHTLESLRGFVAACFADERVVLAAIVEKETNHHIGNIKLGPIDPKHSLASIGIIIGEKNCWGRGYATEAITLMARYAFDVLKLYKLTAGCYGVNAAAIRSFRKAGFEQEASLKQHCSFNAARTDKILLGFINPMWSE